MKKEKKGIKVVAVIVRLLYIFCPSEFTEDHFKVL